MRNRMYDPNLGRFTQTDPIGFQGGMNLYGYAGNNPLTFVDPLGLDFGDKWSDWVNPAAYMRLGRDTIIKPIDQWASSTGNKYVAGTVGFATGLVQTYSDYLASATDLAFSPIDFVQKTWQVTNAQIKAGENPLTAGVQGTAITAFQTIPFVTDVSDLLTGIDTDQLARTNISRDLQWWEKGARGAHIVKNAAALTAWVKCRNTCATTPEGGSDYNYPQRSVSAKRADFLANPSNWTRVSVGASQSTTYAGGISLESAYENIATGETLYVHELYDVNLQNTKQHPSYRNYGKQD